VPIWAAVTVSRRVARRVCTSMTLMYTPKHSAHIRASESPRPQPPPSQHRAARPGERHGQRQHDAPFGQASGQHAQQRHDQHVQAADEGVAVGAGQRQALDLEHKAEEQQDAEDGARAQVLAFGAPQEGRQQHGRQREAHEDDPYRREMAGQVFHGRESRAPDQGDEQQGEDAVEVAGHSAMRLWHVADRQKRRMVRRLGSKRRTVGG
jgi:hypothetical protein